MIFRETPLPGAFVVEPEASADDRGFFARTFCRREFEARGLNANVAQCNVSFNRRRGTLRGMHYQVGPHAEAKLVRCTRGAIYDVIVDLRPESTTYRQWVSVLLADHRPSRSPGERGAAAHIVPPAGSLLYVPEGLAHGFLTLEDGTEVTYQMSEFYSAEAARGVRWNDPAFDITWPEEVRVISPRDRSYADFAA